MPYKDWWLRGHSLLLGRRGHTKMGPIFLSLHRQTVVTSDGYRF